MKTVLACIPCFARQAAEAVEMAVEDAADRERLLRGVLMELASADWSGMPVTLARRIQRTIREATGQADPYRALKARMNRIALDLLPDLAAAVKQHPDPREATVRLAIAGNLLDAGSRERLEPEDLRERIGTLWHMPLTGEVGALFRAADSARQILYLADNAGEIVFDRLLIEMLPTAKVTVAVRGAPIINDATREDADAVGLSGIVTVVDNGSDVPGTLLAECSGAFRSRFEGADLIIAKGQGNYETLSDSARPVFFLLSVKCPVIAGDIGAPVGALVVRPGRKSRFGAHDPGGASGR